MKNLHEVQVEYKKKINKHTLMINELSSQQLFFRVEMINLLSCTIEISGC